MYLGVTLSKMSLEGSKLCWSILSEHYVKAKVANVEESLSRDERSMPSKCATPFYRKYYPWFKESP